MNEQAEKLRYAIAGMAVRYGNSTRDHAYALLAGGHADERARLLRAQVRQFTALQRLARALANLAGGAR